MQTFLFYCAPARSSQKVRIENEEENDEHLSQKVFSKPKRETFVVLKLAADSSLNGSCLS